MFECITKALYHCYIKDILNSYHPYTTGHPHRNEREKNHTLQINGLYDCTMFNLWIRLIYIYIYTFVFLLLFMISLDEAH